MSKLILEADFSNYLLTPFELDYSKKTFICILILESNFTLQDIHILEGDSVNPIIHWLVHPDWLFYWSVTFQNLEIHDKFFFLIHNNDPFNLYVFNSFFNFDKINGAFVHIFFCNTPEIEAMTGHNGEILFENTTFDMSEKRDYLPLGFAQRIYVFLGYQNFTARNCTFNLYRNPFENSIEQCIYVTVYSLCYTSKGH